MNQPTPVSRDAAMRVVEVANAMLSRSMGLIEAARRISGEHLYSSHGDEPSDHDYLRFVGIDSETDHLPIGPVRKYWSQEALRQKDDEIRAYESFARESAVAAAKNLVSKLAKHI